MIRGQVARPGLGRSRRGGCIARLVAIGVALAPVSGGDAAHAAVVTFREGASGYVGTQDTEIWSANPTTSYGAANSISIDLDGTGIELGMIRFDGIIGVGAGQIPPGALINSATLQVDVVDVSGAGALVTLHRMLAPWSEASTWDSMVNGLQFDGTDASATVDATIPNPTALGAQTWSGANLTATLQAWANGATNLGWGINSNSGDGWDFSTSEAGTVALRPVLTVDYTPRSLISGNVFEDANYGGGAGRTKAASAGIGRPGARVELYDAGGSLIDNTTTDASGDYSFLRPQSATYTVRVVNGSVTSSRGGYVPGLWPVQTFRTIATTGAAVAVTDRVGGEVPSKVDAGNGSTTLIALTTSTTTAQSITTVALGAGDLAGVDFGFSFNPVVNRNDDGQGSLRQFLLNANALTNTGLAQSGRPAGVDNAVWMLADGTARAGLHADYASQFTAGVATIRPLSALPAVTDPVVLDGQTQPGWTSAPIVQLSGNTAGGAAHGLDVTAGGSTVRGLTINRFTGAGRAGIRLASAGGNLVQACRIGTDSTGTAAAPNAIGLLVDGSNGNTIGGLAAGAANLVSGNTGIGVQVTSGTGNTILSNAIHGNGGLGIELGADGVTSNDGAMNGGLPNLGMDHAVVTSAALVGANVLVGGYVGTPPGQAVFAGARIELFKADGDPGGFGEGLTYLGALTADAGGRFTGSVPATGVAIGDRLTATATDGAGNTSEFGPDSLVRRLGLVKRAFLADGTPLATGVTAPRGAIVEFLLYVNNGSGAAIDASVQDVMDPGFDYLPGTARVDNTLAACTATPCTGADEAVIRASTRARAPATDAVDADAVSFTGAARRVDAGNALAANAQLDLAAGRVWALMFAARVR